MNIDKKFYKIDVVLNSGEEYKRVLETKKSVKLEEVKSGILKDVFYKIEGDEERETIKDIYFEEISKEVFEELKKEKNRIFLVLGNDGFIHRPVYVAKK